jgi:4-hydroxy-tetrahydrodipicolinate synthase
MVWPRESIIPAAMTPFTADLELDPDALRSHVRDLAIDGVTGLLVCGHAGQITALTPDERRAVIRTALVWPTKLDPAATVARLAALHEASGLPIIWFLLADAEWTAEKLAAIVTAPGVMAVKECSETPATFQRNQQVIRAANPEVAIWTTHSRWLLADLAMGAEGILSSMGSVVADLHVALAAAVRRERLSEARQISERLHPLAELFYRAGHNNPRFKRALQLLGRLTCDACRPPEALAAGEDVELERLLREARLLG